MIDPLTLIILEREPTDKEYMKYGWPQNEWGRKFEEANDKFDPSYQIQKCINKYKRYSKEEQLCSIPIELKSEKKWIHWLVTNGISICKDTKERQHDCLVFCKYKIKQSRQKLERLTKKLKELKQKKE